MRNTLEQTASAALVLDKAYSDAALKKQMLENNSLLLTPVKDKKGWEVVFRQSEQAFASLFNTAVSKVRQPVESLFNRINEQTQIRNASRVRSSKGLTLHLYGKLAAAFLVMAHL